jgi:hypothetical protein
MSFKAGMRAGSGAVQKPAARVEPAPAPIVKYCESCGMRPATKGEYCLPCHKTMFPEQYPAPKPKAEKEPPKPAFSPAFKAAWPDFKQSVESIFKKWPAKLVEWEIIKSEVESKS